MKVWICRSSDGFGAMVFPTEPDKWLNIADWPDSNESPAWACRTPLERVLRLKVPPRPRLLEVQLTAKVLCEWEPD